MKKHLSMLLLACTVCVIVSCSQTLSPEPPKTITNPNIVNTYENAVNGDIRSLKTIATYYKSGLYGFPVSPRKEINCYRTAADLGDVESQRKTGVAYMEGYGRLKSESTALKYLGMAADQGDNQAARQLDELQRRIKERKEREARERALKKAQKAAQEKAFMDAWWGAMTGPEVIVVQ